MKTDRKVTFFIPNLMQVETLRHAAPDADWKLFNTGVQVWVGQTYARLKSMGYPVTLSASVPTSGIVVCHADHVQDVMREREFFSDITIVSARADRPPMKLADFEVVQNGFSARSDENVFFIPHWPQPGMLQRDAARGCDVSNVDFKGSLGEMAEELGSVGWFQRLQQQGVNWRCDAVAWGGNEAKYDTAWNDYSTTDLIVAVRKDQSHTYTKKPASKLINAWLAGVPAILGPEQAYRELRRSELDYIEVSTPAEAEAAILKLKNDPELYRAMVENGKKRAVEFSVESCTQDWAKLLYNTLQKVPSPFKTFVRSVVNGLRYRAGIMLRAVR